MKTEHMVILNNWRNSVVRDGQRFETADDGRTIEKSLTRTCMNCHPNRTEFCDQCHNYAGVAPTCFNCHVQPEELNR